ncbi:MAG: nuclease, partial [Myxococcota bacterium]|nr:nuclease [Myxococcota bacterium]
AGEGTWTCTTQPGGGGYGRLLVDCPDLRRALLEQGMAHVFAMEGTPDPGDIQAQKTAIDQGVGMWSKGAPSGLITSLHSMHERPGQAETYNRVADTVTGSADRQTHSDTYETCQEVCMGDSCMLYVPFEQRYGDSRAACLR